MNKELLIKRINGITYESLSSLYEEVDQSFCLVKLPLPLPLEQTTNYLEAIRSGIVDGKPFICRGIYLDDELIGKVELTKHDDTSGELDIIIKEKYSNQGYGYQALSLFLEEIVKDNICEIIYAYVEVDNLRMVNILGKLGFMIGRRFKADVVVPDNGTYYIQEKQGVEFVLELKRGL